MATATIAISPQSANMGLEGKRKPGRPKLAAGNRARNKAKGFHLSTDSCEMLEQLARVIGGSESHHVEMAIRDYFMKLKLQYREAFGSDYWDKCLDSLGHVDRLKNRRKLIRDRE